MKPTTYLQIPTPCHEDWNKMTQNEQGRFCLSCAKTVVDFQLMTDQQIINYFTKTEGKTCGRFSADQLNRSLVETKIEQKKGWQWLMASIASFFFFVSRSNAQALQGKVAYKPKDTLTQKPGVKSEPVICKPTKNIKPRVLTGAAAIVTPDKYVNKPTTTLQQVLTGDTVIVQKKVPQLIGSVTDESGNGIAYAIVETILAGSKNMNSTNTLGEFEFKNPLIKHGDSVTMKFSCMGYEEKTVTVTFDESQLELHIQLKAKPVQIKEVVVNASSALKCKSVVVGGGISYYSVKPIKKVDTVATIVRKVFKAEAFKIFPNPASSGKAVNLTIKEAGDYTVQLLDNESKLLNVENITVSGKQEVKLFNIPSTIPAGFYYVRIIHEKTKKQYIDKLIVQ